MSVVLKNRIFGYYYLNASSADKLITVYMQVSNTEAYKANFIFPKCAISYIFLFRNPDAGGAVFFSTKAAADLADAMKQPFFSLRIPLQVIALGDPTKKSINFISTDANGQHATGHLFNPQCVPTVIEQEDEEIIRQAVIDGNASNLLNYWAVDGGEAGMTLVLQSGTQPIIVTRNANIVESAPTPSLSPPVMVSVRITDLITGGSM